MQLRIEIKCFERIVQKNLGNIRKRLFSGKTNRKCSLKQHWMRLDEFMDNTHVLYLDLPTFKTIDCDNWFILCYALLYMCTTSWSLLIESHARQNSVGHV